MFKHLLISNDCYLTAIRKNRYIKPKGVMVHSTGTNNPLLTRYIDDPRFGSVSPRHWNQSGVTACVHAFIGKMDNGTVATCQTLPWNFRGWHCASGKKGSGNNTHISFEICEDSLKDSKYFNEVYKQAVELTANLCKEFDLDPLKPGVVICHCEGHDLGIASNHADVEHWFPLFGKNMDIFRHDVKAKLTEKSDTMTQQEWDKMMENWLARHNQTPIVTPTPKPVEEHVQFLKYPMTTARVPISKFRIQFYDGFKKSLGACQASGGFFAIGDKKGTTIPVGHFVGDFIATSAEARHFAESRGKFQGTKYRFDCGGFSYYNDLYGKSLSTLIVTDKDAYVKDIVHAPEFSECKYCISGVPIIRNGEDVIYKTYVKGQGWTSGNLRATWHIFLGLKKTNPGYVYVMSMETKTPNCIYGMEAYKKFKPLGFDEVIKLDGGGSHIFKGNNLVEATPENRRICTVIDFS